MAAKSPLGLRWALFFAVPTAPLINRDCLAQAASQKVLVVAFLLPGRLVSAIRLNTPWNKSLLASRVVALR